MEPCPLPDHWWLNDRGVLPGQICTPPCSVSTIPLHQVGGVPRTDRRSLILQVPGQRFLRWKMNFFRKRRLIARTVGSRYDIIKSVAGNEVI